MEEEVEQKEVIEVEQEEEVEQEIEQETKISMSCCPCYIIFEETCQKLCAEWKILAER